MSGKHAAVSISLAVITAVVIGLGGGPTHAQDATPEAACPVTTPAQNAALVRDYWEQVYNDHDLARVATFLADDFIRHDPGLPQQTEVGLADANARTAAQLADFPDLRVSIDDLIPSADTVVARLTWSGTQRDTLTPWGAPATGRAAEFASVSIIRIDCGRFVEEWALFDDLTMLRQLGIITDEELMTVGSAGGSLITAGTPSPAGTPGTTVPTPIAQPHAKRPRIFIASSVEGLPIAEAIEVDLQYFADVTIWDQGAFHPSQGSLAALDEVASQSDFAIVVLTADQTTTSRGRTYAGPRDNVIFELGLFMGRLGIDRTFMVYNRDTPPDLPSDLLGVTVVTYAERADGNLEAQMGPAAIQIKEAMEAVSAAEDAGTDDE